ncbi:MAG TPA: DUF4162 domain-containing protein, partial [Planctomycetota bacterium]|nr:DUF4162 domain-containing protein [Planctomycetota bacterium]
PTARRELWDAVRELRKSDGTTALLTTHLLEEAETCDRLAIVSRGKLVALGTPDELKAQVGGDVVTVVSRDAAALQGDVETRFRVKPSVVDGALRIEREGGRALVPQLLEAFPGRIESVTVGRPSLEDVFVRRTGRRFEDDER